MSNQQGNDRITGIPSTDLQTKHSDAGHILSLESEWFNMLRKELYDHWRDPPDSTMLGSKTLWWYSGLMVTDPQAFVEICSLELDIPLVFDSNKQGEICWKILNECRRVRGVNPLVWDGDVR